MSRTLARTPTRILAIRLHGLGDVLMTTPALRAARRSWPEARIEMLVGGTAAPAVETNTHIDRWHTVDEAIFFAPRPWKLVSLARQLRRRRFDLGLVFSRSRALRWWASLAGARRTVGLRRNSQAAERPWDSARYEVEDNLALVTRVGGRGDGQQMELPIPPSARARAAALLGDPGQQWLVLAPGGGENAAWRMPHKRWPTDRFASFADAARERWGLRAVVVGGPQDRRLATEIGSLSRHQVVDATAEPLVVSAAVADASRLLLSNDSVGMHLGLIVDTPTVAVFGPTNPRAVLPEKGRFRVVKAKVACSPCFWQDKPRIEASSGRGEFAPCPHFATSCLEEVPLDPVLAAASQLLLANGTGHP